MKWIGLRAGRDEVYERAIATLNEIIAGRQIDGRPQASR